MVLLRIFDLTENSMVVKKTFYVTSWKFRGRIFGRNRKFLNFVEWAKFSVFWRNSFSRVVKTAFRVSRETLWEKWTFPRKDYDFESIFWLWVKNFLFWPKTSPGVSKLKSTCPKTVLNKLPEKNQFYLFLRNLWRTFWVAQKLGFCQQGLFRLQRNFSRKHFLKETKFFLTFRLWTRIFRVSGKTKLTDLPKLHCISPEIHFQKTDFFSRKTSFWFYSKNLRETFPEFLRNFWPCVSNPYSPRPKSILKQIRNKIYL